MTILPTSIFAVTVGLPASGKTTWALQAGFDVAISLDDCRQELWGDHTVQNGLGGIAALLELQERKICSALAEGKSIIVHNTHHLREFRKPIIDLAQKHGCQVGIVYFDIEPNECRRRNRNRPVPVPEGVMDEFVATFEIPQESEANELLIVRRR